MSMRALSSGSSVRSEGSEAQVHYRDKSVHAQRGRVKDRKEFTMISAAVQATDLMMDNRPHFNGCGNVGEDRMYWTENRRSMCLWSFVFAMLGLCLSIVENETRWHASLAGMKFDTLSEVLKGLTVVTTVITLLLIWKYYEALIALRRLAGIQISPTVGWASLSGGGFLMQFVLDIALMLPQPIPGFDLELTIMNKGLGKETVYDLDSVMLCIMMCRVLYIPRFYGECISDLHSDASAAIGRLNRVKISEHFILKHLIANSLQMVTLLTVLQITLFAYVLMIFERPTDDGTLRHYANCVWLIIITMTTVGYGDEYPTTFLGRVVVVMAACSAVIMLAITINLVISSLSLTRSEAKTLEMVDSIAANKELRKKAARVVQCWYRSYMREWRARSSCGKKKSFLGIGRKKQRGGQFGDLRTAVLQDLQLLLAVNAFDAAHRAEFRARIDADIPEIVGLIQCKLEQQEQQAEGISDKVDQINTLVQELIAVRGGA